MQVDPTLAQHVEEETGTGCIWGMSWFLTWFSHTTPGLPQSARLFDFFMASHPLMPLYVGAVAVQASRLAVSKHHILCQARIPRPMYADSDPVSVRL